MNVVVPLPKEYQTIDCGSVRFVKELYPRLKPLDDVIERYRDALGNLPPIAVARDGILVDGYHRWQAHVREKVETIRAENLGNLSDAEIVRESIRRNADHGQQLSREDKKKLAAHLWSALSHLPNGERTAELVDLLSVDQRSVERWTTDVRKAEKDALKARAWDLWLDCFDQKTIAELVGVSEATISGWFKERQLSEIEPPASRQHFDIWQFQTVDQDAGQQSYFGALAPQVVENLLWFYTEPGMVIVDLFAGSGTTIDVAKAMGRRVWASDIRGNHYSPHLSIHRHDATQGWPAAAPSRPDLVLLDPPYWKQAAGRYSEEPGELAETTLDDFMAAWAKVVADVTARASCVAFIISPTQDEDGTVIDHATAMLQAFWDSGWTVDRRIIVPWSTQQATGQQVTWARENRQMLKLYRDLVVMRP